MVIVVVINVILMLNLILICRVIVVFLLFFLNFFLLLRKSVCWFKGFVIYCSRCLGAPLAALLPRQAPYQSNALPYQVGPVRVPSWN